jgi:hypothetical protein
LERNFFLPFRDWIRGFYGLLRGEVSSINLYTSTLKMKMVFSSEIRVSPYKTIRCHNPEDHNLRNCHENLKTYIINIVFNGLF